MRLETQPIEVTVELPSSAWARVAASVWLALAGVCAYGVGWVAIETVVRPATADERALLVAGAVLWLPAMAVIGWVFAVLGLRWIAPRRGRIELLADRLVIHDRWLLARPAEIPRNGVTAIELLERKPFWHYSTFAPATSAQRWRRGVLLTTGSWPNAELRLAYFRCFTEAIWTPPSRPGLDMLCRGDSSDTLFLRFKDPAGDVALVEAWIRATPVHRDFTPGSEKSGCRYTLIRMAVIAAFVVGFSLSMIGLALSAPPQL